MENLERCRENLIPGRLKQSGSRKLIAFATVAAIVAAAFFAFLVFQQKLALTPKNTTEAPLSPALAPSGKSIAILPLENLSEDKENAFFADGIQDDILTSLAKISDLKVISRTSVLQYRGAGAARNLREIGRELGVENILEGSVRRTGNRLLVNVQLINARTDRHIWAERYDRTIVDSLGIQGELAMEIARVLQTKLAPEEKARLETKPTGNPEAYVLYLKALERERLTNRSTEDEIAAEQLYEQAIALDPTFASAQARASLANSFLDQKTAEEARKTQARARAEEAVRLAPTLGETHQALGLCLYWGDKDYPAALKEFSLALAAAPNDSETLNYLAGLYRRQGRWRESIASYQRAQELDPRNRRIVNLAAANCLLVRDWSAATASYNRALEIAPDSAPARTGLAYLEVFRNSNPAAGRKILQTIPAGTDPDGSVSEARWDLAMLERDYLAAEKVLADFPGEYFPNPDGALKSFFQGRVALARDDAPAAQLLFSSAARGFEDWMHDHPDDPNSYVFLAQIHAYMGKKKDAIREARRAVEMEPESQNAFHGAGRTATLALVYALTGETDPAIPLIERLLVTPGPVGWPEFAESMTLADLRLRWEWDALRNDPRFQKLLAGPEPKTVYP